MRKVVLVLSCLLLAAAGWWLWPSSVRPAAAARPAARPLAAAAVVSAPAATLKPAATNAAVTRSAASTNRENFRLTNTAKTVGELAGKPNAILLENALLDTDAKLDLKIPAPLRAPGEPGAYIVQARGPVGAPFRALLAAAGGQIVSYIPDNAYLVRLAAAGAAALAGDPQVRAVLPFAPYFKVQSSLLGLAVAEKPLPAGQVLTVGLFAAGADATVAQIKKLGGQVLATDRSPFGPVVRVRPGADWLALARLPGVQRVEPATHRELANDLSRVTLGISTDTVTNANWMGLSGSNVVVEVNDTGVDANHPDFSLAGSAATGPSGPTRVTGYSSASLADTDGHGTHVAGIIAGNGSMSRSPVNVGSMAQGSVTNADFRGKAPAAQIYSVGFLGDEVFTNSLPTDENLQEIPALVGALISNNSWDNGANEYDLSAASYDAAVRDALPGTTGPQPVLFVFPAGNDGSGNDAGAGGSADTVVSPATAKNVITVGALEQYRSITNTYLPLGSTNPVAAWAGMTDSGTQVAGYSGRGNVGVGTEGSYGRFKPDVVAPGSFVVSTRPSMWDKVAYYSPTNTATLDTPDVVDTNFFNVYFLPVPQNAAGVQIQIQPNKLSPSPLPGLGLYLSASNPNIDPSNPGSYDASTTNNTYTIAGGSSLLAQCIASGSLNFVIADTATVPVNYDLIETIITTNTDGNKLTVLSNLNDTLGPYYYYESGTSMAAAGASGSLALLQDYFTNTLHSLPSPALLKAMLINGARPTDNYEFAVTNDVNYEGWGLVSVPNSLPAGLTNAAGGTTPLFLLDQSPTNWLATGDQRTFNVTVPTALARAQFLRVTLAWTDPPGNPAAGLKLVNNLDLLVTNLDTGDVYYGNYFGYANTPYSLIVNPTNSVAVPDAVNNVENVWLLPSLGTNYTVTVVARNVAVNAVTTEQTNVVQDFALAISCGDAQNANGITVAAAAPAAAPPAPPVTFVTSFTNGIYFDQIAGANAPWLSTNAVPIGTNAGFGTNASLFVGQTNQWHFYVVTNTTTYTNAAFIIFLPETLATPRMGVFESSVTNSTRPEADLNFFVASAPDANAAALTNLDLLVVSNCVYNTNGDQSSLGRGGTKFIVYSNAQPGQVYYVGVQCADQMGADYGFVSIFSLLPFSQPNPDGSQTVNGLMLPMAIPDGSPTHAGVATVFGLAVMPMDVAAVTVTNTITHESYGNLVGALTHSGAGVILNNHDGFPPYPTNNFTTVYNDNGLPGTTHTDGPGSLSDFVSKPAVGPWLLTEVDNQLGNTGSITGFSLNIQPLKNLGNGLQTVSIPPKGWFYGVVDAVVGDTNLLVVATNLPPVSTPAIQLYLNYNSLPAFSNYLAYVQLTNGIPPFLGNAISYGPPMLPGSYYVGLYNPDVISHNVLVGAFLSYDAGAVTTGIHASADTPVPLVDDAVMYDSIFVTDTNPIQKFVVGLRVNHPRISDLVFTLINPAGARYLLMENRGGQSTNGCGLTVITTNFVNVTAGGNWQPNTNYINVGLASGSFPITYNFYTAPDEMTVYYGTNVTPANRIYDTGLTNNPPDPNLPPAANNTKPVTFTVNFPPAGVPANSTYLTIVMNQNATTNRSTAWTYTAGGVITNYEYLAFTEDTNLTVTPIKYAPPPFVPAANAVTSLVQTNYTAVWDSSFEGPGSGSISAPNYFAEGWQVLSSSINWIANSAQAYDGTNFIDLQAGSVATNVPTVAGGTYRLTFAYAPNPDAIAAGVVPSAQFTANGTNVLTWSAAGTNTWANLQWAVTSVVFTAASTGTNTPMAFVFTLSAGTNGMLLDGLTLDRVTVDTNIFASLANLYYQPEQDISGLIGSNPYGEWQLEILDNRIGATNNASLVSWALNFTFANTNLPVSPPTLIPGQALTNVVAAFSTNWFFVNVPANARYATNTLLFATAPVFLWYDTNTPPQTNFLLLAGTSGTSVLSSTGTPAIVPGGSYWLGVQNPNAFPVTNAIQVDFLLANSLLAWTTNYPNVVMDELTQTNVSGTLVYLGTNALTYSLGPNAPAFASINATSGVVYLAPQEVDGPSTNVITVKVADNGFPPAVATTNFTVIVNEVNVPPVPANIPDQIAYANEQIVVDDSATDSDLPANTLTYSLLTVPPAGLLLDTNTGLITWTPTTNQVFTTNLITVVVTDYNPWALANQSLSATNSFTITVLPPFTNGISSGLLAFPGAEGAGGYAIGGRGGDVYHVTNLLDDGPGSLRYGLRASHRTIVFDVSGTVNMRSDLRITRPYVTIAAQTAPGGGFTMKGRLVTVQNTHDVQIRFMRFRPGDEYCPNFQDDAFHFRSAVSSIVDHVSASWSIDEVLSATYSDAVTVQWSMIADSLNDSCHLPDNGIGTNQLHGYGSLLRYGNGGISYHHNLYADNYSRNPRLGDNLTLDFVNNVISDWGIKAGYSADDSADNPGGFTNRMNYVGNYLIASTNASFVNIAFEGGWTNTWIYQSGNFIDPNLNGVLDGANTGWAMFSGQFTQFGAQFPMPPPAVTTDSAPTAYERVLAFVGANESRDTVDSNIVSNVRTQTGRIINSQSDVGGWPVLASTPPPPDFDQDGMPNYWEVTLGMDPYVPNNNVTNSNGYTDLENYLNWLAAPHAVVLHDRSVDIDLFALAGSTGNLGFSVANGTNGTVTLQPDGHTARFTPTAGYHGFASFSFNVTDNATGLGFGPVPVSVLVSLIDPTGANTPPVFLTSPANQAAAVGVPLVVTNTAVDYDIPAQTLTYALQIPPANAAIDTNGVITFTPDASQVNNIYTLTTVVTDNGTNTLSATNSFLVVVLPVLSPGQPETNVVSANSTNWFLVNVPANALQATNSLVFATAPVNLWHSTNIPPSLDFEMLTNQTGGSYVLDTAGQPRLVPGSQYFLGVQNTNNFAVTNAIEVSFHLATFVPVYISSVVNTNIGGTNGWLVSWFAPADYQFHLQFTASLAPVQWHTFNGVISELSATPTNGLFQYFDNGRRYYDNGSVGSPVDGFSPIRFYRLQLLNPPTNTPPFFLTLPVSFNAAANQPFIYTNAALDWDIPAQALAYAITNTLADTNVVINTNTGAILWTPNPAQIGRTNLLTVSVTDSGVPAKTATDTFAVVVYPQPVIGGISAGTNGVQISWTASTNEQFNVRWTTNLVSPVVWTLYPSNAAPLAITSTNGAFVFVDTNTLFLTKFYQLILLP